jgi:hypothetical protein
MKCSECKREIEGKIAYRHTEPLCNYCFEHLRKDGRVEYQKYWESYLNHKVL